MIKKMTTNRKNILAFEAIETITKDDYNSIIVPNIEKTSKQEHKLRILYFFGPEFKGFTAGAAWEDFKIGTHYFSMFEKIAVVSDSTGIRQLSQIIGSLLPCSIKTFTNCELESAMTWLEESNYDFEYTLDKSKKIIVVKIDSKLSSDTFNNLASLIDPIIATNDYLNGLIIHIKNFPQWSNLGSLTKHIQFVKNHQNKIKKVAFVTDSKSIENLMGVADLFVHPEIKHFSYNEKSKAEDWMES